MKFCNCCKQSKKYSEFNKKGKGYQSRCRDCQKLNYKNYYNSSTKEKDRLVSGMKIARDEIRKFIAKVKDVPCIDCGVKYPSYVMDFDHLENKEFNISSAISFHTIEKIKKEILKCEVVCSNCHRIRTHQRKHK